MHKTSNSEEKEKHEQVHESNAGHDDTAPQQMVNNNEQNGQNVAANSCKEEIELLKEKDEQIAILQKELADAKEQYLRKLADYENFRKRMFRERDEAVAYANTQLLTDLVDVLDNFDRAIQSAEVSKDFTALHDGIVMIQKHFLSLLEGKYGLKRFDSLNAEFDPHKHEAMSSETGDCDYPVVIEEYSKGYMLKERVLRTARVKVRMPQAKAGFSQGLDIDATAVAQQEACGQEEQNTTGAENASSSASSN